MKNKKNIYQCKNQTGAVGPKFNGVTEGVDENDAAIKGFCLIRHGRGSVSIDGHTRIISDNWSFKAIGGPTKAWTTCFRNLKKIGAVNAMCAGIYGIQII